MIKLYHCKDARSLRCLWLLEELNLPYALDTLEFPPRDKAPGFLDINPVGTVPFLVDGNTALNESGACLEYLAARYAPAQWCLTAQDAAFGAWLNWIHFGETLTTPLALVLRFNVFEPEQYRNPRLGEDYTGKYFARLALVDEALRGHDYLCADRFTIADISVGYALFLASFAGLAARHPPAVTAYLDRLRARPAFKAARKKQALPAASG